MSGLHDAERRRREKEREQLQAEHDRLGLILVRYSFGPDSPSRRWIIREREKLALWLAACDRELATLPK